MAQLFKLIGRIIIIAALVYTGSWIFNWLPPQYLPSALFEQGTTQFRAFIAKDATSTSMTAGISKAINDYLNNHEKEAAEQKIIDEQKKKEEAANTPLNKAQQVKDNYEKQIQKEKEQLDEL